MFWHLLPAWRHWLLPCWNAADDGRVEGFGWCTAAIQSSSATTVAAVGFVASGLLIFPQALGIIFGANIGTTMTGWLGALLGFKLDLGQRRF